MKNINCKQEYKLNFFFNWKTCGGGGSSAEITPLHSYTIIIS